MPVRRGGAKCPFEKNPIHTYQASLEKPVRPGFDPVCDGRCRWPTIGWIVFEPTVVGRIVRRRDNDSVSKTGASPTVVHKNRVRNNGGRCVFIPLREHDLHPVRGQDFKRACDRRHGKGMRIHAKKERTINLVLCSIQANGLSDGKNMPFIERLLECRATMTGGAEHNPLARHRRVGLIRIVSCDESGNVDQRCRFGWLPGGCYWQHQGFSSCPPN